MKYFAALATILNIVQGIYSWFQKQKMLVQARTEVVAAVNKDEEDIKDATDKELNSDVSDSDLDKRLQDGSF